MQPGICMKQPVLKQSVPMQQQHIPKQSVPMQQDVPAQKQDVPKQIASSQQQQQDVPKSKILIAGTSLNRKLHRPGQLIIGSLICKYVKTRPRLFIYIGCISADISCKS